MSFLESKRLFICAHWQHSASKADRKWNGIKYYVVYSVSHM